MNCFRRYWLLRVLVTTLFDSPERKMPFLLSETALFLSLALETSKNRTKTVISNPMICDNSYDNISINA